MITVWAQNLNQVWKGELPGHTQKGETLHLQRTQAFDVYFFLSIAGGAVAGHARVLVTINGSSPPSRPVRARGTVRTRCPDDLDT